MATVGTANDRAVETTVSVWRELLGGYTGCNLAARLWDGTVWESQPGEPANFTLVFHHAGSLRKMFTPPSELAMAEAYIYDDIDIEGDIESIFPLAEYLQNKPWGAAERLRFLKHLHSLPGEGPERSGRQPAILLGRPHSRDRDRQAVTYHYDTSNDFFRLWLDTDMVYSCAYFAAPDDDLDLAQQGKLDYICRKLRLNRGEHLLDIGCGWGGLAMHAARGYGVNVSGITLSQPQADLANERIRQAGLSGQCRVEVRDYREIDEPGSFDKLVSVGMFEHVGESELPAYFAQAWRLLRPGGVFLNHGIASNATEPPSSSPSFSDKYVFPDGELLPIHTTLRAAESTGFEVRDVESLREHYALTLRHWVRRLEARHAEACQFTDEATYRVWRLFMSGSAYRFQTGRLNVYQALLLKSNKGTSGLPLTRADWYDVQDQEVAAKSGSNSGGTIHHNN